MSHCHALKGERAMEIREKIAKAIWNNHEEQCCNCGEFTMEKQLGDNCKNFLNGADAILRELQSPLEKEVIKEDGLFSLGWYLTVPP